MRPVDQADQQVAPFEGKAGGVRPPLGCGTLRPLLVAGWGLGSHNGILFVGKNSMGLADWTSDLRGSAVAVLKRQGRRFAGSLNKGGIFEAGHVFWSKTEVFANFQSPELVVLDPPGDGATAHVPPLSEVLDCDEVLDLRNWHAANASF